MVKFIAHNTCVIKEFISVKIWGNEIPFGFGPSTWNRCRFLCGINFDLPTSFKERLALVIRVMKGLHRPLISSCLYNCGGLTLNSFSHSSSLTILLATYRIKSKIFALFLWLRTVNTTLIFPSLLLSVWILTTLKHLPCLFGTCCVYTMSVYP